MSIGNTSRMIAFWERKLREGCQVALPRERHIEILVTVLLQNLRIGDPVTGLKTS